MILAAATVIHADESGLQKIPLESGSTGSGLLSAPVSFYHDYNMAFLFPVGKELDELKAPEVEKDKLSLDDCIQVALGNSPTMNKARQNVRATVGDLLTAWGEYLPRVNASYGLSQDKNTRPYVDDVGVVRDGGGINSSSYINLSFSYTVFDRGSKYFLMKNARYSRQSSLYDLEDSELEVVSQVRRAYFDVLRLGRLVEATDNQLDQREEQLRYAEARYSVGSVTRLDVMQAKIDLENMKITRIEYENQRDVAKLDLMKLMGVALDGDFEFVDEYKVSEPTLDIENLTKQAIENHPSLKSLALQIKTQKNNLWMGRLSYLPTINSRLNFNRNEDYVTLFPNFSRNRGLNATVSWNIFNAFTRFDANRKAEVRVNNLQYDYLNQKLTLERDVRSSYLDLLRIYKSHLTLKDNFDLATSSLEMERERYRLGSSSLLDLRQAQVDYSSAESDYINSIYQFHSALADLSRKVGKDLYSSQITN